MKNRVPEIAPGLGIIGFGVRLGLERTVRNARALLLATVAYLPAVFCVMVWDRHPL